MECGIALVSAAVDLALSSHDQRDCSCLTGPPLLSSPLLPAMCLVSDGGCSTVPSATDVRNVGVNGSHERCGNSTSKKKQTRESKRVMASAILI